MACVNRSGSGNSVEQLSLSGRMERVHLLQYLRSGIVEGLVVAASAVPGARFDVSAGRALMNGRWVSVSAVADQATGVSAPGAGSARIDLIELTPSGNVVYTQGVSGTAVTDVTNAVTSASLT